MEQLASARWTTLQELDLGCLQFSSSDLQQLQNMRWPQLTALELHKMICVQGVTTNSFQAAWQSIQLQQWPLAKLRIAEPMFGVTLSSWSSLTWLDVSSFALRPDQVEMLLHARGQTLDTLRVFCRASSKTEAKPNAGSWPCHTFLRLEVLLDEAVLHSLSLGFWPAKVVDIVMEDADRVSPDTVGANLRILDLLRLNSVLLHSDLTVKGLKAESVRHLVGDQWCEFEKLDMSCVGLKQDNVQHLVNGRLPLLRELGLSYNLLTSSCLEQLTKAQWPCLEKLDLHRNSFDSTGVQCLVKGQWPSLTMLDLSFNELRSEGMKHLVQGDWPVLAQLHLQHNVFNKIDPSGWSRYEVCSEVERRERRVNAQQDILHCLQRKWAQLVVCFEHEDVTRSDDLSTQMDICVLSVGYLMLQHSRIIVETCWSDFRLLM